MRRCLRAAPFAEVVAPRPRGRHPGACRAQARPESDAAAAPAANRRAMLSAGLALSAASLLPAAAPPAAQANRLLSAEWELVDLPLEPGVVILDVGFTGTDPDHGALCRWG